MTSKLPAQKWLHRYALLTAAATLALVGIGGVVTSRGVGMAVPDWPTTYGYNMFFFPFSKWVGGIFYEHSHRLVASVVGLLVVGLTRWLGGRRSRLPLALIGAGEVLAGIALLKIGPDWKGTGHFLSGIGGVVLLGAAVWARNEPTARPLPLLGWMAFWGVQLQGLLGGLRVVLFKDALGIFHATLAQLFFVLLCAVALLTSGWWRRWTDLRVGGADEDGFRPSRGLAFLFAGTTALILGQLILGATMRHQHAGLAIPDFPLAYGKLWPAMDAESVARYNAHRLEATAVNPITAAQIGLQMVHRVGAAAILVAVGVCAWRVRRELIFRGRRGRGALISGAAVTRRKLEPPYVGCYGVVLAWLGLILVQALLGAATIWSDKAADIATAHVVVGALSLALGATLSIIWFRAAAYAREQTVISPAAAWPQTAFGPRSSPAAMK
jgi:cytochrome c oxidase assembly protein subunit 15